VKLGLNLGYSGAQMADVLPLATLADRIGIDSVWAAEAYGSDAVTVLAFLAAHTERIALGSAILQMPARTPANGVPYGRPLTRTREYVEIVRRVIAREDPLRFDGEVYQVPYRGADATGLGRPLRSILHPVRPSIPIYLAAIGPNNVALAGEIADGWIPIFYAPEHEDVFAEHLRRGAAAAGRSPDACEVAVTVMVAAGDDVDACRDSLRPQLALYIGGMGSRERNFYHDLAVRYGYEHQARIIQDAFLDGRRDDAAGAVPDKLIDEVSLVGPIDRILDRVEAWKASHVDTLILGTSQPEVLRAVRDAVD
jgi:F420-dependent oxidoreductase-like protein